MKAFGAAAGVAAYCMAVGYFMFNTSKFLDHGPETWMAPVFALLLLSVSVCVCGLIFLTRPFLLFWEEKKPKEALYLLFQQTMWLFGFVVVVMGWLILNK